MGGIVTRHVRSIAAVVFASACLSGALAGCSIPERSAPPGTDGQDAGGTVVRGAEWMPLDLAVARPGLVGWRRDTEGRTVLVRLVPGAPADEVWEGPDGVLLERVALDVQGERLAALVRARTASATVEPGTLVTIGADGGATICEMPDGYEEVFSGAFLQGGDLLVVAAHTTKETIETTLGAVDASGAWRSLAIAGSLPTYQFIESVYAIPGTDAVAIVLKTPGGPGDRDDEALVLARRDGDVLRVFTEPFGDDALPTAAPLWGAEGVVVVRARFADEQGASPVADLVEIRWQGNVWSERVRLTGGAIANGIETGGVVAAAPDGTLWVRSAPSGAHGSGTGLLRLASSASEPETVSVDLSDVFWFQWIAE